MSRYESFLVVDLEATCDDRDFPREDMETIEVGAVLVEGMSLQPVREFQSFIRPVVRPRLTPFCTRLTSITQEMVDGAPSFPEVMRAWAEWLGPARPLFASWGAYDKHQLEQDARRWGIALPVGSQHLNIKNAFAEQAKVRRCGMRRALTISGLPLEGTHHRGIDDARNIVRLLPFALGRRQVPRGGRSGGT